MSLTGIPLLLLAALATAVALAATVFVWRRFGRWRYVVRPAGVLLIEALLTFTAGLAVNRSQRFYPDWSALLAPADAPPAEYHTVAGRLDEWLTTQPNAGGVQTFPWAPPGWKHWQLAGPPSVTVPEGYLAHPALRYSAVVVLGTKADAWPAPTVTGPTVLVHLVTDKDTPVEALAAAIPDELDRDLRVTGHRWGMVVSAADSELGRQVAVASQGRFPVVAFVGVTGPAATPSAPVKPPGKSPARPPVKPPATPVITPPATPKVTSSADPAVEPPAKSAVVVTNMKPGLLPAGIEANYFQATATPAALDGELKKAVDWAAAQTPPPLAESAPEPTSLPTPTKKPSDAPRHAGRRAVTPHGGPGPMGGPDGPR